MLKVVINKRFGGFHLSVASATEVAKLFGDRHCDVGMLQHGLLTNPHDKIVRHHPHLVEVVEKIELLRPGNTLEIKTIPIELANYYHIHDYDGVETIAIDYGSFILNKLPELTNETIFEWKTTIQRILSS